jgi:hypothetical protein
VPNVFNRFILLGLAVSLLLIAYRLLSKHRRPSDGARPYEHAVFVHLKLSSALGTPAEVAAVRELSITLERVLRESASGEYDGDEFGGGECVLYMYGDDADVLFDAIAPTLRASTLGANGWVSKRYGRAKDQTVRTARVDL